MEKRKPIIKKVVELHGEAGGVGVDGEAGTWYPTCPTTLQPH